MTSSIDTYADEAADLLGALAHPGRVRIIHLLSHTEEASAGELVAASGLSQSATSQHLAKLKIQGLVTMRREGQMLYYRLVDHKARAVLSLLDALFGDGAYGL